MNAAQRDMLLRNTAWALENLEMTLDSALLEWPEIGPEVRQITQATGRIVSVARGVWYNGRRLS